MVTTHEINIIYSTKKGFFLFAQNIIGIRMTKLIEQHQAVDLHCRPMASPKEGCDGTKLSGRCLNLLHAWNAPAGLVRLRDPARGSSHAWLKQAGQNSHLHGDGAQEPVRGPLV